MVEKEDRGAVVLGGFMLVGPRGRETGVDCDLPRKEQGAGILHSLVPRRKEEWTRKGTGGPSR